MDGWLGIGLIVGTALAEALWRVATTLTFVNDVLTNTTAGRYSPHSGARKYRSIFVSLRA